MNDAGLIVLLCRFCVAQNAFACRKRCRDSICTPVPLSFCLAQGLRLKGELV